MCGSSISPIEFCKLRLFAFIGIHCSIVDKEKHQTAFLFTSVALVYFAQVENGKAC